jgi:glycosyltransferase involved in cell wall biosynthesis
MLNTGQGGMEEVFRQYNVALSAFCDVVSVIHEDCQRKEIVTHGSSKLVEINQKFGTLSAILHVRDLAKKHKVHLVIVHDSPGLSIANISLFGLKIKKISVRHTFFSSKFSMLRWKFRSDVHLTVNKKLSDDIGGPNTHVVYNALDYDLPDIPQKRNFGSTIKIGFLGRVVHNKGAQFLVKALGLLVNKKKLNCEVVIGGDGRYLKALKHLTFLYGLNDRVNFLGYVNDKEQFFNSIDIFCLPSLRETFGLVLLESIAHSIPVIASNIPGIDEVLTHGENGMLFTPGDHHDLADQIATIITHEDIKDSIVNEALIRAKQSFTINRLQGDLHRIISTIE